MQARSEAVLPAYLIGLVMAGVFLQEKVLAVRIRTIAFAILTPFYFIKAGLYVRLDLVLPGLGLIIVLLLVKIGAKALGCGRSPELSSSQRAMLTTPRC